MLPIRDENPHPPGFKPMVTYALIIINVIVFFIEVIYTGQFIDFTNENAFSLFYNWGAVPNCVTGATASTIDFGAGPEYVLLQNFYSPLSRQQATIICNSLVKGLVQKFTWQW